jgi:DNA-directed RNA polymerase specialized sigma24 family protein
VIVPVDHLALVRYVATLVGPEDAEDVAQDTYVAMLSTPRPYDGREGVAPMTWVLGIAKRLAYQHLKARGRRHAMESPAPMADQPIDWPLVMDALDEGDRALVDAKLTHGTTAGAARATGLTYKQFAYRWARLKRRVE